LEIKKIHATVLLLIYFGDQLWHRKFVTADVTAVFVNNQHDITMTTQGQDYDKKLVFERIHNEEVDRRIS